MFGFTRGNKAGWWPNRKLLKLLGFDIARRVKMNRRVQPREPIGSSGLKTPARLSKHALKREQLQRRDRKGARPLVNSRNYRIATA